MSSGLDDETTTALLFIAGIVLIIIGSVMLKNALDVKSFEDNATKEYVIGYVEEEAVRSGVGRNTYKAVFSFEYTLPSGNVTKQTIKTNKMSALHTANRMYPIGTTKQIVIFNQDIKTARLDIDSERYHKIYNAYLMLIFGAVFIGIFIYVTFFLYRY